MSAFFPNNRYLMERPFIYDELIYKKATNNCIFCGLWQTELYFNFCERDVRRNFVFTPFQDDQNIKLAEKMKNENSVAIHIRKGADYLKRNIWDGTCSVEYYNQAINYLKEHIELCEKEVKANHVIWPLSFNEMGNDLATVYDNLEKKQATVFEFLKKGGIEPSEISLAAPKVNDTLANNYGPNRPPFRYIITQVITIATDKVDTVRKLMEAQRELLKQGVALTNDYSYMTNYSFTGLNEIKPKMIEIATKNAKEAAKKFAEDSGSKLGKIRRANQGVFSITDRDDNTPFIKNVRVVTTVEYFLND